MANEGAYIDLKQVDFYLQDGFAKGGTTAAVMAVGATTVTVTGILGTIPNGITLNFGTLEVYGVTASALTGGNVTSITFSPPLITGAASGTPFTVGPNQIQVKIGEGNLTFDEKVNREYKMDRGKLDQVRDGDEVPIDVSFQFAYIYLTAPAGAIIPTVEDFFKRQGPAANYVSTGKDCEPYAVNIVFINRGNAATCGGVVSPAETVTLPQFRYESLNHDLKAGTVSASGKCNVRQAVKVRS